MFPSLLLAGCGNMGAALLKGWLAEGLRPDAARVVEPHPKTLPEGVAAVTSLEALDAGFSPEIVVLALKPQALAEALPAYRRWASEALFVSIAAGKRLAFFEEALGKARVVRVMPNTPALVGEGASVACGNAAMTARDKEAVTRLFDSVGHCHWLEDEALMDAVTALSGSGPAFFFYITQCLAEAAAELGLDRDLAVALAVQTLKGSGALAAREERSLEALRQAVTSPGGTTAAGLSVLMDGRVKEILSQTLREACRRGKELAG